MDGITRVNFAESATVLVPRKPKLKAGSKPHLRKLAEPYFFKWRGRWYCILAEYEFDGASIPWASRWLFGDPFADEWICGAAPHDASYTGDLYEVSEETALRWLKAQEDGRELPGQPEMTPIWMPPDLADQMFTEVNRATLLLLWWKARVALRAINLWHSTLGKGHYILKTDFNDKHSLAPGTHERCVLYHGRGNKRCEKTCEGFFGSLT